MTTALQAILASRPGAYGADQSLSEDLMRSVPDHLVPLLLHLPTPGRPVLDHVRATYLALDYLEDGLEVADVARDEEGTPLPPTRWKGEAMRYVMLRAAPVTSLRREG